MMQLKGHAHVKKQTEYTENLFGDVAVIHDQILKVIDRNEHGDCLCLLPSEDNLIDVDYRDVKQFLPNISVKDPLETVLEMLKASLAKDNHDNQI